MLVKLLNVTKDYYYYTTFSRSSEHSRRFPLCIFMIWRFWAAA